MWGPGTLQMLRLPFFLPDAGFFAQQRGGQMMREDDDLNLSKICKCLRVSKPTPKLTYELWSLAVIQYWLSFLVCGS